MNRIAVVLDCFLARARLLPLVYVSCAALYLLFELPATAQDGWGLAPVTVSIDADGRVEMRDAADDTPLLLPRSLPAHQASNTDAISPRISMTPKFGGFDLEYEFTNRSALPRRLGRAMLGIFTLGEDITTYNFRRSGEAMSANIDDGYISYGGGTNYPTQLYSAVGVLANDQYAIGVSIQYPVMDWKHDVEWSLRSPSDSGNRSGEGGQGWAVAWKLSNMGWESDQSRMRYPATLPPGEQRKYIISVRVTRRVNEWVRTLVPYREYFRSKYGHITYERAPQPIKNISIAGLWELSDDNPYGMTNPYRRPDLHGWRRWTEYFLSLRSRWDRIMLWCPTGVFYEHQGLNLPFLFTSHWMTGDTEGHQMGDALDWLPFVHLSGMELGLWWGNSSVVHYEWDDGTEVPFDPSDPDHRARAFRELDLAEAAGATIIGLDNFSGVNTPIWELFHWLREMQVRYPGITFSTESRRPDLLHRIAPTTWRAMKRPEHVEWPVDDISELYAVTTPLILADFILAGHETWCIVDTDTLEIFYGRAPTEVEYHRQIVRIATMGYVPIVSTNIAPGAYGHAAETWWTTLPRDLVELPD